MRSALASLCATLIPALVASAQVDVNNPRWYKVSTSKSEVAWIDTTRVRMESGKPVVWLVTKYTPPSAVYAGDSLKVAMQHISVDCGKLSRSLLTVTNYYTSGTSGSPPSTGAEDEAAPGSALETVLTNTCKFVRRKR